MEIKLNNYMSYDENDDFIDDEVNDIISQIKKQGMLNNNEPPERIELQKEDMENFIVKNAANVVHNSMEMVEKLKTEVVAGADAKLIESVAELVKATTAAIDSLSKLKIADDKIKSQKELTQMQIDSKKSTSPEEESESKALSRGDIMKLLGDIVGNKVNK